MSRFTLMVLTCLALAACGGGSGGNANKDPDPISNGPGGELLAGPVAVLDTPPLDGKLPANLYPPSESN